MIQDIITYGIISWATGYTIYQALGTFGIIRKKKKSCGCGSGSCKV